MAIVSFKLLSIFSLLVIFISHTNAQFISLSSYCTNDIGNYTANSTYQTNLNTLLSNLSSNTEINYGFYNFSYGQNSNKVNAIGLCRGDVKPDDCRSCLNDSRVSLTKLCPNQKEAIIWYDQCLLRYSNRSIFGKAENSPYFHMSNQDNATDVDQFNQVLRSLMYNLTSIAASGNSMRKFAAANASAGFQTIYGLVQCTPDLSQLQCENCLIGAISEIPRCCDARKGGRVLRPSCNIRYEIYRFSDSSADTPLPQAPPPPSPSTNNTSSESKQRKSNTSGIVIAIVAPIVALIVLVILICIYLGVRKSKKNFEALDDAGKEIKTSESLQFHFDTIKVATNNFSDANKLGQGGFGVVYRGRLTNGQEIAVKRLSMDSGQGDTEFKNEVSLVAKLQHRNLVRLLGFCLEGRERLLIYEFVQNKSLDCFIFDPTKRSQLNWSRRYKIILDIARGLLYLHEDSRLKIIHRDLKASNILLDDEMNAKISDFGMARLIVMDQTQVNTSRIVGTYGYMAPEYLMRGQFSVKSDIFSFGVLVLEIITGHKNSGIRHGENMEDLLSFTWKSWREGTVSNIIDPTLNNGSRNEMLRGIHIGLLCVQENIIDRPTMATVLLMLNSYSLTLPVPSQPAFLMQSGSLSNVSSRELNSRATRSSESRSISVQESKNDVSITELYPR